MPLITFKGGIHPPYNKEKTSESKIKALTPKNPVYIPLQQHIGAVCEPLVKKGEYVKMYQKIGDSGAFVSSPVHSSVSGTVTDIKKYLHPNGNMVTTVIIESDGQYIKDESLKPQKSLDELTPEEIITLVHEAGIVGMGGAGFPAHIKMNVPKDKKAEYVIINGAECEPYLSSDHRSMVTYPDKIIFGIKAIMKASGAENAVIAIEDNKRDAEQILTEKIASEPNINLSVMQTKYPQGSEKHIIKAILDREVPSGGLPIDVGVIVNNIDTCIAVSNAITDGEPVVKRRVTVSGDGISWPGVFEVPIGMLVSELLDEAGGLNGNVRKLIMGGPMMGTALFETDVPIIKTTSGILALSRDEVRKYDEGPCLRCGKCVEVCPMNLMPLELAKAGRTGDVEKAVEFSANDCIECGSCSFICPSGRLLVESIRLAKSAAILHNKGKKG